MPDLKVVEPAKPTTLEGLVEDYLASCRARGLSPKTIRDNYGYALKSVFLPWAAAEGITDPDQVTSRALDRFTAHRVFHARCTYPSSAQPNSARALNEYSPSSPQS